LQKYWYSSDAADFHKAVVTFKKLAVNTSRILWNTLWKCRAIGTANGDRCGYFSDKLISWRDFWFMCYSWSTRAQSAFKS